MFERDARALAARLEPHLDDRALASDEVDAAPDEREVRGRIPCRDRSDLVQRVAAVAVLLEQPAAEPGLEMHRAGAAPRDPVRRTAPPPLIDLLGEHRERVGEGDPDEGLDADLVARDHGLPRVRSACALKADSSITQNR